MVTPPAQALAGPASLTREALRRPSCLTDRIVRSQADQGQLSEEQIESFKEAFLVFVSATPNLIPLGLAAKVFSLLTG